VVNEGGSHRELQDQKALPRAQFLMGDLARSEEPENLRI